MAAIPYIDGETVQQNLDRVRTYFELLNMPFEVSKKGVFFFNPLGFSALLWPENQMKLKCLLNFLQALLAFIAEHDQMFTPTESASQLYFR